MSTAKRSIVILSDDGSGVWRLTVSDYVMAAPGSLDVPVFMSIIQAQPLPHTAGSGAENCRVLSDCPLLPCSSGFLGDRRGKVYSLCHLPQIAHRGGMIRFPIQPSEE